MRNFLAKLRYKLSQFMVGRYGVDQLYQDTNVLLWILIILNLFLRSGVLSLVVLVLIVLSTLRAFSKNHAARRKENNLYLKATAGLRKRFNSFKRKFSDKDHVYRNCPHCHQTLRLPKNKGRHTVHCPKCSKDFDVRI